MANKVDLHGSKPPPLTNELGPDGKPLVHHVTSTANQHVTFGMYGENLHEEEEEEFDSEEEEDEDEEDEEEEEEEEWDPCILGLGEEGEWDHQMSKDTSHLGFVNKRYRRHHFIKHEICIPDKSKKFRPPPPGRPWYLPKKKTLLERRQDSAIAFIMPKQEDPEVIALRKTNKMVQKLIKYMKKSWKIRVNRKQEERELEHRTLVSVYTKKPADWLERIAAREQRALETGFFSAMDVPYNALIDLELDTALLTFKNLPPDLKITAARWIRMKLRKEELKKKRDAYLPRLPHGRTQRPSYNKGRLIKDPGGVLKVDQFVKVAEGFAKVTRGATTFSKVLKEWSQKKEKESNSKNSGFGIVREGMFDFSSKGKADAGNKGAGKDAEAAFGKNNADQRRVSIVDARKYQRDMLYYEKVLLAMYDIVKSLLNIKTKQLESKFPLPLTAVIQIRSKSPDQIVKRSHVPELITQRNERKSAAKIEVKPSSPKTAAHGREEELLNVSRRQSRKSLGVGEAQKMIEAPQDAPTGDRKGSQGVPGSEKGSKRKSTKKDGSQKENSFEDVVMDFNKRPTVALTAEQKIKRLAENPDHAAIRRARNYMTYTKLFERNKKYRKPVWHNIDIAAMALDFNSGKGMEKDPTNLNDNDAAEIAEKAMQKRRMMNKRSNLDNEETTKRWPDEFDIPTPTFPFQKSVVKIPSEEQSRLNLLKKTPHMDEVPSTPVRRLYKLAGVRTVESDVFHNIMEMKKKFRVTETKLRIYYENEIGKWDWDTLKRFRGKLGGIRSYPVYQWSINAMRSYTEAPPVPVKEESVTDLNEGAGNLEEVQKRPALWYKTLVEEAESNGATRHNGCHTEIQKLSKYCDVDMRTKPHMLNRLALLTASLPTTELGTKHWQQAVIFLLEHMCGTPPEIIHEWLKYRGLPFLL